MLTACVEDARSVIIYHGPGCLCLMRKLKKETKMSENQEGAIATLQDTSPTAIRAQNQAPSEAIALVNQGSKFLPYISLGGSTSTLVKQGKLAMGDFAIINGKNFTPIGDSFDCICFGWRARAMDFSKGVSIFDVNKPEFEHIRQQALNGVRKVAFGAEYLLYLPDRDEFVLYFFGSISARNESPNLLSIYEAQESEYLMINIKSDLITNKKEDSWHVQVVTRSENAVTKLPAPELLTTVLHNFNNPKDTEVPEQVEQDSRDR